MLIVLLAVLTIGTVVSPTKYKAHLEHGLGVMDGHEDFCTDSSLIRCGHRSQCIQRDWLCDTERDCLDGSDEANCPTDCSGANQFQCGDTQNTCIAAEFRCDGNSDCPNGTDENDCHLYVCSPGEVKCADNHMCMEKMWVCDSHHDCTDGSDEQNCKTCQRHSFLCASDSVCIDTAKKCDGHKDCSDNADEQNCDDAPSCQDKYSAYLCGKLNETEHPFCLENVYAPFYCPKFCFNCHNVSVSSSA